MSVGLEVEGELTASLGELTATLKKHGRSMDRASKVMSPVFFRVVVSGIVPAAGPLALYLQGPDQGHFWYVRSISIGGLTTTTVAPGRADIFVTAAMLSQASFGQSLAANIGLQDWRDQAVSLPLIGSYSRGELPLRLNENLYAIISNGTVGQTYVAAAQIEDYEEASMRQEFAV